ncbi:hypothetical protein DUNSADRAFT_3920 [Dunaliella salina]|uniref:Uncharacterized protein n=1 Tax=Dunaliella salina TaxID=3046 RepID=A0ABQ7FV32_DUNSA|nr:hypothetical protein DUNSADRAFT_3920 [Dunaliella salina]|eukprot:KAF5826254.1 hypothetical protein DUNSADRAFT_3920 [Dunaliella salina]
MKAYSASPYLSRPDFAFLLACRPAEADLLFSDVAKRRALKASKRSSIKRVHRYANLLLAYRYAIREVSVNDHISLVRNRDLEALRRRQQMADGGKRGRLSRALGFEGYVGSADAQMPHGPPLGAFDDEEEDSSEEEGGEEQEEEEEEEEVEDSGVQDTAAASQERSAGGVDGLATADQGGKEGEGERKEPRASMVEGQKGHGNHAELGGGRGIVSGHQDRERGEVVAEGKGLAAQGEQYEGGNEKEDEEEDEMFEVVDEEEEEEEEEEEDDDDTWEEWESQDGKPPEVEITITVDKEGDKGKGDGYNCEVQLGPEADDFTARFNVNEAAVDQPAMDAMLEADGLGGVRTFLERCFKEEVRNLHTIQQLEKLWNRSSSSTSSASTSSDTKGKNSGDNSMSDSTSSSGHGSESTGASLPSKNSLTTRLNRQNRLSTGRRSSSPAEGPRDGSASSTKDGSSTDDGPLREGRRARPPYRMSPTADRSNSTNEGPDSSSSSSSSRSSSSGQSPQERGIGGELARHKHGQDHSSGVSRPGQDDAQGRGESMMPRRHSQEPQAFDVQGGSSSSSSSGSSTEADQTGNVAGEGEGQELSVAEERDAAARRVREMRQQSSPGQGDSNRTQGSGSRNSLDPDEEPGRKGTGRSLGSSTSSSSNSLSDAKGVQKDGDDARDEDSEEANSKDLPAEDSEEAQQLAHELLGRPVSSSEAAALVAALRQATDVFAVPEIAAAEAAQKAKAQAAAEAAAAAAAAAAVIAGPGGTTNTYSLSDLLQAWRDGAAAAAASAGGGGGKPGVSGKRGGGSKGKKSASDPRESRGKQLGRSNGAWDDNNVDAMTRALMEVFGLDSMGKGMGNSARLGRQRPQQQVRLLLEEWPGAWAQPPPPQVPETTSPSSRSSALGNGPSPSRVPARRSRGSIFGRPLASRAPAAPPRGLGAAGVTPAGISWGAIGGVGLALGSSGAEDHKEQEQEQEEQRRSSVRDLSVVARLMEALHKPPTEVTGEAGKDIIVTLDSGDGSSSSSSSSSSAGSWDSADAEVGWSKGGPMESDLIREIGDAWCEYEQELMGKWVEGVGLSPAAFLEGS